MLITKNNNEELLMLQRLQDECLKIRSENRDLKKETFETKREMKRTNDSLLAVTDILTRIAANTPQSSPSQLSSQVKKRHGFFFPVENGLQGESEQTELKRSKINTYEGSESIIDDVSLSTSQKSNEDSVRALPDIYKFGIGSAKNITDLPVSSTINYSYRLKVTLSANATGENNCSKF
jgi:hypothetical protein